VTRALKVLALRLCSACRIGRQGIGLPLGEHVEEVGRVGEVVAGLDRILAFADQLEGRHHRGDLGQQPDHRGIDVFGIVEGTAGIEEPQRGRTGLQRVHGVPLGGEALHHVADAEAHPPVHLHLLLEFEQLLGRGQFAPDQQVGRLQKGAVGGEGGGVVAPVGEMAPLAVDVADGRLGGRNALQTRPEQGGFQRIGSATQGHAEADSWSEPRPAGCRRAVALVAGQQLGGAEQQPQPARGAGAHGADLQQRDAGLLEHQG